MLEERICHSHVIVAVKFLNRFSCNCFANFHVDLFTLKRNILIALINDRKIINCAAFNHKTTRQNQTIYIKATIHAYIHIRLCLYVFVFKVSP